MKILYTNFHPRNGGGHATYVTNLARALSAEHEITVATPGTSRLFAKLRDVTRVQCLDVGFSTRLAPMQAEVRHLRELLRREQFDLVHVNGSADHRQAMLARVGLRRAPRIVWTKHNTVPVRSFGNWMRARLGTDGAIGVCDYVSRLLRDSVYRSCLVRTIRLGVNTTGFRPHSTEERQQARSELLGDLPEGTRVLGSVAGTDRAKGWLTLIRAAARLPRATRARVRFLIAGDLPRADLRREVAALAMEDCVVFPGLVSDPRRVLAASDVAFVLSLHEAGSYAACESLACGLPVLVSDAGGLPELVRDGTDGWVIPAGDEPATLGWLARWLAQPLSAEMPVAARLRALECFAMPLFVQQTLAFYREVCAGPRSTPL